MLADLKKIHAFAEKWLPISLAGGALRMEMEMGCDCRALGFVMDCGQAMGSLYPCATQKCGEYPKYFKQINNIPILGSGIYSKWRYYQHWDHSPWDCEWFSCALAHLAELTDCPELPSKSIERMWDELRLDKRSRNPLQELLFSCDGEMRLERELAAGFDVGQRDAQGLTPLMYCAAASERILQLLLRAHADCNAADNDGNTVLMYLCNSFDLKAFDQVLERGADINAENRSGLTVLDFAVMHGLPTAPFLHRGAKLRQIPVQYLPSLVAREAFRENDLFNQLAEREQLCAKEFLWGLLYQHPQAYVDLIVRLTGKRRKIRDFPPVKAFPCFEMLSTPVLERLQMHLTPDGKTVEEVLGTFEDVWVDTADKTYYELLKLAIHLRYYASLSVILQYCRKPDCGIKFQKGRFLNADTQEELPTPLMIAVQKKDFEAVRLLLAAEADPTTGDSLTEKESALGFAVRENEMEIFQLLLKSGADPNFALLSRLSPMNWAVKLKRTAMRELLLAYGASPEIEEKDGAPPAPPHAVFLMNVKVAGTFVIAESVWQNLKSGLQLQLVREPRNPHDPNAITVQLGEEKLGYVPRGTAELLAPTMDRHFCLFGRISEIDRAHAKIFLDIFQRILIPLDEMTSVSWQTFCAFPPVLYRNRFFIRQRKFVQETIVDSQEVRYFEIVFTEKEWLPILDRLRKCNFLAWERDYSTPGVYDAPCWSLCVRLKRNRIFRSAGDGLSPEEEPAFLALLHDCRDLAAIRGSGSFRIIPWNEYLKKKKKTAPDAK